MTEHDTVPVSEAGQIGDAQPTDTVQRVAEAIAAGAGHVTGGGGRSAALPVVPVLRRAVQHRIEVAQAAPALLDRRE
jgi:hypothetical protein